MKPEPRFKSEVELCAAFCDWARAQRFTPYPETDGWDIVLVAPDGTQIGVQAKMKFNMAVLQQTIDGQYSVWHSSGPDYRAILLPEGSGGESICDALGITVFRYRVASAGYGRDEFYPDLKIDRHFRSWHYWNPEKRIALPEYVPDVPAGASGPVQLTRWKIAALKVVAVLEIRGYVTRQDFSLYGIDHRRWIGPNDWLIPGAVPGQYVAGSDLNFAAQHPVVYPQVLADVREEMKSRGQLTLEPT